MIVPSGKRRPQVNQGPLKNASIFDASFFKEAIGSPSFAPPAEVGPDLQNAMNSGGLDKFDQAQSQNSLDSPMPKGNSVQPQGEPVGTSPAARFFGKSPEDEEAEGSVSPERMYLNEQAKIRKFIGNDMGMRLKDNQNGTFTVVLTAPGPISDPDGFIKAFMQTIGRVYPEETETPSRSDPKGKITLTYVPQGASPPKITKHKGR